MVPTHGCLRGCVDDLRNFYHEFEVTVERALSTPVGPSWNARAFSGTGALERLKRQCPDQNIGPNTQVFPLLRRIVDGAPLGASYSPSCARGVVEGLLRAFDALRREEHLEPGRPLPAAPLGRYTGVCVADTLSLQVFDHPVKVGISHENCEPARDLEASSLAESAYSHGGLEAHPKKAVQRGARFQAWGAEFDGNRATVGINRTKLAALCPCTCRIACKGVISVRVLQKLLGLWAFAMQFRRPLFSLLHVAYHVSHRDGDDAAPFRMPRDLQQALQLTSILGFLAVLAFTDLKTQVASQVFASDASPRGGRNRGL